MSNSKYQEALDRLCKNDYFDEKGNCNCDLIVMDRILLQELVDKAAPKKPIQIRCEPEEKYVIASTLFKGDFALSRIVDCNHIYKAIEESKKQCLSPKKAFKIFVAKGWLDYYE
ncbi:MAG: hypothetical protein KH287_14365 [Coprobacillus sp.]|nr:hypothetical protein [Coprobacillus sp.]